MDRLLENNKKWADRIKSEQPDLLKTLDKGQNPEYLWIGCADSRVPPNLIVDLQPGELFVHRNIANVIDNTDINALSVIQYAVESLQVKHIVVCGHYGCGGVGAAMEEDNHGFLENWLGNIKRIYEANNVELEEIEDEQQRYDRMCELNVVGQVKNIVQTPFVRNAWKENQSLSVHGLIYDIESGLLKDLDISVSGVE